jgi:hypothetical protein
MTTRKMVCDGCRREIDECGQCAAINAAGLDGSIDSHGPRCVECALPVAR